MPSMRQGIGDDFELAHGPENRGLLVGVIKWLINNDPYIKKLIQVDRNGYPVIICSINFYLVTPRNHPF